MYLGGFESFGKRQRRKDGRQAFCHHALARTWRTHHDEVVSATGSNGKSAFHGILPLDIGKVGCEVVFGSIEELAGIDLNALEFRLAVHEVYNILKVVCHKHFEIIDHSSLACIFAWHDDAFHLHLACKDCKGEATLHGLDTAIERQFADHHVVVDLVGLDYLTYSHYGHGNGHVIQRTLLAHIGRRKVDGNLMTRETQSRLTKRTLNSVSALFYCRVW